MAAVLRTSATLFLALKLFGAAYLISLGGPAPYELIRDAFVCEPRGSIPAKGEMESSLLVGRRAATSC